MPDHAHEHLHDHHHPHAAGNMPPFLAVKPILNVASVPASLAYYRDKLGFEVCWTWGDEERFDSPAEPTFAEVQRGAACLMLGQGSQGRADVWMYIDLPDARAMAALHAEYQASGALIAAEPADKPWGMREMLVNDPDGHTLRIGAPLEHPSS